MIMCTLNNMSVTLRRSERTTLQGCVILIQSNAKNYKHK